MPEEHVILLVDDDPSILDLYEHLLKDVSGIRMLRAVDGGEAIDLAREKPPRVILLDHLMPGIDGFTACQVIRSMYDASQCTIWFVTATAKTHDVGLAKEIGASRIIPKPFDRQRFKQELLDVLDNDSQAA